jgi:hypothetical protein
LARTPILRRVVPPFRVGVIDHFCFANRQASEKISSSDTGLLLSGGYFRCNQFIGIIPF